jgi:hypothetical protein
MLPSAERVTLLVQIVQILQHHHYHPHCHHHQEQQQ